MNIQDCVVEKGFVFELELDVKGWNCSVKSGGEFIDNIYGFKLEVNANPPMEGELDSTAGRLVLTLEGYRTDLTGELAEAEGGDVVYFSRSFTVKPDNGEGKRIVLIVESESEEEKGQ